METVIQHSCLFLNSRVFRFWFNPCKMKHLQFVLLLAIAANFWECGDAKFGEKGELSPRRRRCYDGSLPKRLKKKERKLSLEGSGGGEVCHRLYPRVSCCPSRRAPYQILHRRDARVCSGFLQPQISQVILMRVLLWQLVHKLIIRCL